MHLAVSTNDLVLKRRPEPCKPRTATACRVRVVRGYLTEEKLRSPQPRAGIESPEVSNASREIPGLTMLLGIETLRGLDPCLDTGASVRAILG